MWQERIRHYQSYRGGVVENVLRFGMSIRVRNHRTTDPTMNLRGYLPP